jgi:hypothetical protein
MLIPKFLALTAALLLPISAGAEEREPTTQERTAIEQVLRAQGYSSWDRVEREGDVWEIGEAVYSDGRSYEVKLNPSDLSQIERDAE